MKKLLIMFGLWLARLGGLPEPSYDKALMGLAKAGVACWEPSLAMGSDDMFRKACKTACEIRGMGPCSPELRFAVAREIYARMVAK